MTQRTLFYGDSLPELCFLRQRATQRAYKAIINNKVDKVSKISKKIN